MDNTIHSDLIRGHIDTIILKALYDGDRYGFDIIKEIEQKSSGQYIIKQPTLYSCLKRLEVQGFIKSYWGAKSSGGRRKYFTLTDMGRDLFIKNQSEWVYSRSVIDKLISDKDFDFGSLPSSDNATVSEEDGAKENLRVTDEAEFDEETEEPEQDDEMSEELEEVTDEFSEENSQSDETQEEVAGLKEEASESRQEEEISEEELAPPVIEQRPYLDTTAIMNEMFENQLRGGSYTEKLKNDDYVPSQSFDPNNYFNDNFDEPAAAARAVPDDDESGFDDSEEIIRGLVSTRQPTYVSPLPTPVEQSAPAVQSAENRSAETATAPTTEAAPPVNERPVAPDFYRYDTAIPTNNDENTQVIRREYKNILMELRDRNVVDNMANRHIEDVLPTQSVPEGEDADVQEQDIPISEMSEDQIHDYKIRRIETDLKELGDGVKVRKHNTEAAKEYTNTFYYYSNKLMLSHYLILFLIMIPEIAVTFLAITLGSSTPQKFSVLFLILCVVIAALFPLIAFILNMVSPLQKKRIKFNFKISMIFRVIVMIEALVLIYTINLMLGMPLTFSSEYLVTLLVPGIMCTNIPISAMIFQSLFKSEKYNVEG